MSDEPLIDRPCAYAVLHERTSPMWARMFAKGCRGRLSSQNVLRPGAVAMFGSPERWEILQQAIQEGRTWYYGDHGLFLRGHFYRITKNAYQHSGKGDVNPTRWRALGLTVQPWRKTGRNILLCPQTEVYHRLHGMDRDLWLADIIAKLRAHTDRPIITRTKLDTTPIEEALQDAWAVVSYSSAVAIDAMLAGVPQFTLAPWATAYPFGTDDLSRIEDPVYPEGREKLFCVLANNQWTYHEISRGSAWRAL